MTFNTVLSSLKRQERNKFRGQVAKRVPNKIIQQNVQELKHYKIGRKAMGNFLPCGGKITFKV